MFTGRARQTAEEAKVTPRDPSRAASRADDANLRHELRAALPLPLFQPVNAHDIAFARVREQNVAITEEHDHHVLSAPAAGERVVVIGDGASEADVARALVRDPDPLLVVRPGARPGNVHARDDTVNVHQLLVRHPRLVQRHVVVVRHDEAPIRSGNPRSVRRGENRTTPGTEGVRPRGAAGRATGEGSGPRRDPREPRAWSDASAEGHARTGTGARRESVRVVAFSRERTNGHSTRLSATVAVCLVCGI